MRVSYRYVRPTTVVFARGFGPYEKAAADAWRTLEAWLTARQVRSRPKLFYGYMRDNPRLTAPELLRFDACVPAIFGIEPDPEAGIGGQTLPGGAYAIHTHVGSYGENGRLLSHLYREVVPKRGLSIDYDRPLLTIHLNDPMVTREVHRRTELCVPVLPVRMPLSSNDDDAVQAASNIVGMGRFERIAS